jgi:hypothetical protein
MIALQSLAARLAASTLLVSVTVSPAICDPDRWFQYRSHSDRVTPGAGNAAASNIAAQTVDPWPPYSTRKRIDQDGKRALKAIKRYETNTSITPNGFDTLRILRPPLNDLGANSGGK